MLQLVVYVRCFGWCFIPCLIFRRILNTERQISNRFFERNNNSANASRFFEISLQRREIKQIKYPFI